MTMETHEHCGQCDDHSRAHEHCGACDEHGHGHTHDHCGDCDGHGRGHTHDHCGDCGGHGHTHDDCGGDCENCDNIEWIEIGGESSGECDECGECGAHEHSHKAPDTPEQQEKRLRLAAEVLDLARSTLLVNLRFLDAALNELIPVTQDDLNLATNGQYMLFSPGHILWCCKNEQERPVRDYLHVVLHCVFRHMYVDKLIDQRCWDLACDIAVEYSITRLGLAAAAAEREALQQGVYAEQLEKVKQLTAERIYRFLLDGGMDVARMEELAPLFYADEHALWYSSEEAQEQPSDESSPASSSPDEGEDPPDSQSSGESSAPQEQPDEQMEERWSEIARRMQVDMETFSREKEDKAGGLVQNLREANRERYDYGRFLKKFAVRGEVVRINDDEFDYIYYTYGLKLYGKMPLVEPLEYKEVKRIREFVIAIDTSGSVSGKMVQLFVQKTYNILKTTESFFSKINLHIIQCDAQIQEAVKITSQREFDRYMEAMEIHGLGGTDFRPVFRYVDELREKNEFENLRGLIYLTDGFGTFPKKKPEYETAFVFVDDGVNSYDVPSWAIRLILQPEELY